MIELTLTLFTQWEATNKRSHCLWTCMCSLFPTNITLGILMFLTVVSLTWSITQSAPTVVKFTFPHLCILS